MLFWTDDVSVIRVSRWGITRGTLSSQHVLTYIWMIITDNSFKIVSNYTVVTEIATVCRERKRRPLQTQFDPIPIHAATPTMSPLHVSDRSLPACVPSMRSTAAARANPFLMDALINKSKSFFWKLRSRTSTKAKKKKGIAMAGTTWLAVLVTVQFPHKTENSRFAVQGKVFRSEQCS